MQTVNDLIKQLIKLQEVGMGDRRVVVEDTRRGKRVLVDIELAGSVVVLPVEDAPRCF